MPHNLPVVALALLLAADAASAQPPPVPTPQNLLPAAIQALERYDSVDAKLRYEVNLFHKRLLGSGAYCEQRPGRDNLLRLEIKLQFDEFASSLVLVCDGRYLWQYRNLPSETKLVRIDVTRVLRALDRAEREKLAEQRAPGTPPPLGPPLFVAPSATPLLPGIGGLPKLLRGLESNFEFTRLERGQWGKQKQPVWGLHGQWKRERLVELLPNQKERIEKGEPPDLRKLPRQLPDEVVIVLGQQDLFPYRIEFRRQPSEEDSDATADAAAMVVMTFYEVNLNVPLDRTRFIYNPPSSTDFSDQTESFIQSLGLKP